MNRATCRVAVLACLVALAGCGGSSLETVPVGGVIRYRGQPLIGGTITFHPVDASQGRPATAKIQPDGRFTANTLQNVAGLVSGKYLVSVFYLERPLTEASPAESKIKIPTRYQKPQTSGLTLEVASGQDPITFDIELTDNL